jgi:hypothetical protein
MKFGLSWRAVQLIKDLFLIFFATRKTNSVFDRVNKIGSAYNSSGYKVGTSEDYFSNKQHAFNVDSNHFCDFVFLGIENLICVYSYYALCDAGPFYTSALGQRLHVTNDPSYNKATDENKYYYPDFKVHNSSQYDNSIVWLGYDENYPDVEYPVAAYYYSSSYDNLYYWDKNRHTFSAGTSYADYYAIFSYDTGGLFTYNSTNWTGSYNYYNQFVCGQPGLPLESED